MKIEGQIRGLQRMIDNDTWCLTWLPR